MRNIKILVFTILISTSCCRSQDKSELNSIKEVVAKFLLNKGEWNNREYDEFKETGNGFAIYGIYNTVDSENLKEGVYGISRGTHTRVYFLLYENRKIHMLDLSTKEGLYESIKEVLKYSFENKYCVEIINEYLSTMIGIHYSINKKPRTRIDSNCKQKYKPIISQISLSQLKLKLVDYLVKENKFKDVNHYLDDPEYLAIEATDIYYGISKENIDVGMYFFLNNQDPDLQLYYLLVSEGDYEILSIDNGESLNESINEVLGFAENNKYCHKITKSFIQELINTYFSDSCLESFRKKLP